jgi:hypothetical protein
VNLVLRRKPSTVNATVGELYMDGSFHCYVLEDVVREVEGQPVSAWKVKGKTAIPQGKYAVTVTKSERFKRDLPLVNMVPGFEGVRIHPGNHHWDTEGCLLPGMNVGPDGESVVESRYAFNKLFGIIESALHDGDPVWLDVRNA